jgi:hypothetical protein
MTKTDTTAPIRGLSKDESEAVAGGMETGVAPISIPAKSSNAALACRAELATLANFPRQYSLYQSRSLLRYIRFV